MPLALTPTQARVLRMIAEHIVQWQRPPSRREVANAMGWSSANSADEHIRDLAAKGWIALDAADSHARRHVRVLHWPAGITWAATVPAPSPAAEGLPALLRAPVPA